MEKSEKEKWILAGKIGKEARDFGVSLAEPGAKLLDIALAIEKKISDAGAKPAFPPNLSLNYFAAHYTPKFKDATELKKGDLLKIDVGASVDGYLSDTAATVLVGGGENKVLDAAKEALSNAIKKVKPGIRIDEISKTIEEAIRGKGCNPIVNLGGHGIERYSIHEADFIPNIRGNSSHMIKKEGAFAIEPFATDGGGYVVDSPEVQILMLVETKPVRSQLGRQILDFIASEYNTLPFAKRWILEKFGIMAELELKPLVSSGALYEFNVLKEQQNGNVAQFEHTLLIDGNEVTVTTE